MSATVTVLPPVMTNWLLTDVLDEPTLNVAMLMRTPPLTVNTLPVEPIPSRE